MANIQITINTDNAAFDDNSAWETRRILNDLKGRLYEDDFNNLPKNMPLIDLNGSPAGVCKITKS